MTEVTVRQIGDRFGVRTRTVMRWIATSGFPRRCGAEPTSTGRGLRNLYQWAAVKEWAAEWGLWDEAADLPTHRKKMHSDKGYPR